MKIRKRVRQLCMFVLLLSLFLFQSIPAYAVGDGNLMAVVEAWDREPVRTAGRREMKVCG